MTGQRIFFNQKTPKEKRNINVVLYDYQKKNIDICCEKTGMILSDIVREAIDEYLESHYGIMPNEKEKGMPYRKDFGRCVLSEQARKKTVTFSDRENFMIDYICEDQDMTISQVIRNAVELYFLDIYGTDYPEFDEYVKKRQEAWRNFER